MIDQFLQCDWKPRMLPRTVEYGMDACLFMAHNLSIDETPVPFIAPALLSAVGG